MTSNPERPVNLSVGRNPAGSQQDLHGPGSPR